MKLSKPILISILSFLSLRCSDIDFKHQKADAEPASIEEVTISKVVSMRELKNSLDLHQKIKRLYLEKDAVLKTEGSDVDLEVEEIDSLGGKIVTFEASDFAKTATDGQPSGNFHLKTSKIIGPLTIEIRGQSGGPGYKGAPGTIGSTGNSRGGYVDVGFQIISNASDVCSRALFIPDNGHPCLHETFDQCLLKHPGLGEKGGTGGPGFQGMPGAKGGDTNEATLDLPVTENLTIIYEAGLPGPGGEGGDGGPGGPGGAGAGLINNSRGRPCDPSPQGPTGDQGIKGPQGPDGKPGEKSQLLINGVPS